MAVIKKNHHQLDLYTSVVFKAALINIFILKIDHMSKCNMKVVAPTHEPIENYYIIILVVTWWDMTPTCQLKKHILLRRQWWRPKTERK